ncbi:MAG: acyltransferase family protein [Geminicoccaceae bacterium]|nr:acyltransferase family protein [Geminicoccaceae bacterium]
MSGRVQLDRAGKRARRRHDFRPDIQGLRGVAVLLVVIYHAGLSVVPGGYTGVDVFFVISGYLITGLLVREIEQSGGLDLAAFYARRIRRLLPAATVVLLATTAVAMLLYSPLELKQFVATVFMTAVYLSNFWFAQQQTDYLAEDTSANPLLHTWSLAVEEQFYLVWPLLLLAAASAGPVNRLRSRLLVIMLIVGALSLAASVLLTWSNQPWAFFGSPTRAWQFALGGLIALWSPDERWLGTTFARLAGLTGLAAIIGAALAFTAETPFPGYAALLPTLGAAMVVAAGHASRDAATASWLGSGPLRFLGDISYSLYLWHWPVFVFLQRQVDEVGALEQLAGLTVACALAWLTYLSVENPVRSARPLIARPRLSLAFGLLLSALPVSVALTLWTMTAGELQMRAQQRYLAASDDLPRIYADGCHLDFREISVDAAGCSYAETTSRTTVVLFGDSHAAQWFPALEAVAEREGWRLVSLTKAACPALPYAVYLEPLGRTYVECAAWRERALARIAELRPEITIVANSNREWAKDDGLGDLRDESLWLRATRRLLGELAGHTRATVFLRDTRDLPFDAPTCLSRADWQDQSPPEACAVEPNAGRAKTLFERESAVISAEGAHLIDMRDAICPVEPCPVERNGRVLYRDSHHLTASFAADLAGSLHQQLAPIVEQGRRASKRTGGAPAGRDAASYGF